MLVMLSNIQVSSMELCKRRRGIQTEATYVSSSRFGSDDDVSEYEATEEGRDNAVSSSSVSGEDEVSSSCGGALCPSSDRRSDMTRAT